MLLEVKKDLLTSIVALARNVAVHRPAVLVGHGQGGIVAHAYGRPLAMELALQARNVQVSELMGIAEGWAGVKLILVSGPRLNKVRTGTEVVERSLPEAYVEDYPVENRPTYGIMEECPKKDEVRALLERMKVRESENWSAVPLDQTLRARSPEVWSHEGVCACGRKTYLFARCPRCIREEAAERHQEQLEKELLQ